MPTEPAEQALASILHRHYLRCGMTTLSCSHVTCPLKANEGTDYRHSLGDLSALIIFHHPPPPRSSSGSEVRYGRARTDYVDMYYTVPMRTCQGVHWVRTYRTTAPLPCDAWSTSPDGILQVSCNQAPSGGLWPRGISRADRKGSLFAILTSPTPTTRMDAYMRYQFAHPQMSEPVGFWPEEGESRARTAFVPRVPALTTVADLARTRQIHVRDHA